MEIEGSRTAPHAIQYTGKPETALPKNQSYFICIPRLQRGDTEAQTGFTFCMLLGQVAITGSFKAQLCYVDFDAAELETCQLWPTASAAVV